MLLNKHEKKYKHALSLDRERSDVWKQIRAIAPIKLDVPIFNGYIKTIVIDTEKLRKKDEITCRKLHETFHFFGVHTVYSKDKSFKVAIKHKGEKLTYYVKEPGMRSKTDPRISFYRTEKRRQEDLEFITGHSSFISTCNVYNCYCIDRNLIYNREFKPHLSFDGTRFTKVVVNEHYLTHYTPVRGDLEERLAEIDAKLRHMSADKILWNNHYYRGPFEKYEQWKWNGNMILHALDNE